MWWKSLGRTTFQSVSRLLSDIRPLFYALYPGVIVSEICSIGALSGEKNTRRDDGI